MNIHWVAQCPSTNSLLAQMPQAAHGTAVAAHEQTAGRGQRGNSWEAEPGKNLTFSLLLQPHDISAARQFELSMLVSLAIADSLDALFSSLASPCRTTIKWPNDIYVGGKKIVGILIENTLAGNRIASSIAGIGVNINQTQFLSNAPNPTSVAMLTGRQAPLEPLLNDIVSTILSYVDNYDGDTEALRRRYMSRLMCISGSHPFSDAYGSFHAHITNVAPDGIITLSNGRSYAFKELIFEEKFGL